MWTHVWWYRERGSTLWKKILHFEKDFFFKKCIKFGTNSTHINFFLNALRVFINIIYIVNVNTLWIKNTGNTTSRTLGFFSRRGGY